MSYVSTAELAELTGITVRQIQRLLAAGSIPGAERTPGGHWQIPDSKELRKWASRFKKWDGKPRKPDFHGVPIAEWRATASKKSPSEQKSGSPRKSRSLSLEDEIEAAIQKLKDSKERLRSALDEATGDAGRLGQLLEVAKADLQARGGRLSTIARSSPHPAGETETRLTFGQWLRKCHPSLQRSDADWLVSLAKRDYKFGDGRRNERRVEFVQRLIKKSGDSSPRHQGVARASNPFAWIKWAGKIRMVLTSDKVANMDAVDKSIVVSQLEPLAALLKTVKGGPR